MISIESPALSLSQATDSDVRRRRALELFCLSFVALFLELMVIRWEPAVVRLIAYYANLMLISSFLGLGVGAIVGKKRKDDSERPGHPPTAPVASKSSQTVTGTATLTCK